MVEADLAGMRRTGPARATARVTAVALIGGLVAVLSMACGSSDGDSSPATRTAPTAAASQSGSELDPAVRAAYEGYVLAINENRLGDALTFMSACQQKTTSVAQLEFGRAATGTLTLRSLTGVSSNGAEALIAAEIVTQIFVGNQNLFRLEVPMINENGRWLLDGPPKCTV